MSITIHPELEARLRARAEAEGLSIEAYLERIARDDERAEQELEVLALEGLNSGESIVADERYWENKRRRLIERHEKTGTP
jgi:predicted kinase